MSSTSPKGKWERTNLRLPAVQNHTNDSTSRPSSMASGASNATAAASREDYLCLPPALDSSTILADNNDKHDEHDEHDVTVNHHVEQQQQHSSTTNRRQAQHSIALDRYLSSLPQLAASTQQLLHQQQQHTRITSTNSGRVINVLQGEMAHCTPAQADVLVSDDATTCHILGLWSCCRGGVSSMLQLNHDERGGVGDSKLATLAHIDGPGYDACIRDAVDLHYQYHSSKLSSLQQHQQQQQQTQLNQGNDTNTLPIIQLSIHLMGGYNDNDGTSLEITQGVLRALSNASHYYVNTQQQQQQQQQPRMQLIVQTCAVSSSNDNGSGCPIGRGLALDVNYGTVYLAEVQEQQEDVESSSSSSSSGDITSAQGPDCLLRQTRLWASFLFHFEDDCDNDSHHKDSQMNKRRLQIIHHSNSNHLSISPFYFAPHPFPHRMLALDDALLLQYTSSSPEVEKDNFVRHVRETFRYMNRNSCFHVFQKKKNANKNNVVEEEDEQDDGWLVRWEDNDYLPRRYRRVGLNGWVAVV